MSDVLPKHTVTLAKRTHLAYQMCVQKKKKDCPCKAPGLFLNVRCKVNELVVLEPVLTLPVPGTWRKSPSRDRTLCCVTIPASSFALTASPRLSTNSAILSPAEAVCSSCCWSLGGKLLLGQHPKGKSFYFVLKFVFSAEGEASLRGKFIIALYSTLW